VASTAQISVPMATTDPAVSFSALEKESAVRTGIVARAKMEPESACVRSALTVRGVSWPVQVDEGTHAPAMASVTPEGNVSVIKATQNKTVVWHVLEASSVRVPTAASAICCLVTVSVHVAGPAMRASHCALVDLITSVVGTASAMLEVRAAIVTGHFRRVSGMELSAQVAYLATWERTAT